MVQQYGLIFDVDGVMGNTEPINAEATIAVLAGHYGVRGIKPADFEPGLGRGARKYTEVGAAAAGVKLSEQELDEAVELRRQKILELIRQKGLASFAGVLELLEAAMASAEFQVAIASSAERELVYAILEAVGAPYEQMVCLTGCDVSNKKPHPEIFLTAAGRLKLAGPECVVIEDAPEGVAAAHNAGCRCIAVTNSVGADQLEEAELVVASLAEVGLDTLRQLVGQA